MLCVNIDYCMLSVSIDVEWFGIVDCLQHIEMMKAIPGCYL